MATVLGTYAGATASPHTITFTQSAAGSDVLVFACSAAVMTFPAGWVKDAEQLQNDHSGVWRLPGAQNGAGVSSVEVTLSAARALAAVVVQDYVTSLSYDGWSDGSSPGGAAWGTGLHTYTADAGGESSYAAFVSSCAGGSAFTGVATSLDQGFTLLGQDRTASESNEGHIVIVGQADDTAMTNDGVTATLNPSEATGPIALGSQSGMVSYVAREVTAGTLQSDVESVSNTLADGSPAATDTVTVSASDSSGVTVSVADDAAWLSASPASGAEPQAFTITSDPTGLADGTYNGTLTFSAAGYDDITVPVTLVVSDNPIVGENSQPGSGDTGYTIPTVNGVVGFLGYSKQFSVNAGETIDFAVDGTGATDIAIYRIGHYDYTQANQQYKRLHATISNTGTNQAGNGTTITDGNGATKMNWTTTASWAVPAGTVSGLFVAVVRDTNGDGQAWIPFVVRNDGRAADVVVKVSWSTWGMAYNYFGDSGGTEKTGASLYGSGGPGNIGSRAYAVSADRPIVTRSTVINHWDAYEMPLINYLESNGYNVKYISDYDLDQQNTSEVLDGAKVLVSAGHDEYWSQGMWDNAVAFRAAGGHLLFLSANEILWRVRWADGGRTMWCYKDTLNSGVQLDPVTWTGTWRDTRRPGGAEPESLLSGTFFRMNARAALTATVDAATYGGSPFWRDTTVESGTDLVVADLIGFEADEHDLQVSDGVLLGATTANIDGSYADDNGEFYTGNGDLAWGIVLFRAAVGSGVTASVGTMNWLWFLSEVNRTKPANGPDVRIQQATANILADMGAQADTLDVGLTAPTPVSFVAYGLADEAGRRSGSGFVVDGTSEVVTPPGAGWVLTVANAANAPIIDGLRYGDLCAVTGEGSLYWLVWTGQAWEASPSVTDLDGLTDVDLTVGPTDGQTLIYDNASSTFKAGAVSLPSSQVFDVTDYGATGDGTTDDTAAIIAARDAWLAQTPVSIGGKNAMRKDLFFPAGKYLVTSTDVLMTRPSGTPGPLLFGARIFGMGKRRTSIIFSTTSTPSSDPFANNLGTFDGRVQYFRMEGISIESTNANQSAFYFHSSNTNPNQDIGFTDVEFRGDWKWGYHFGGPTTDANLNSEIFWNYCAATPTATFSEAVCDIGSGVSGDSGMDQFLNYTFNFCKFEIDTGDVLRITRGGAVTVWHGSWILGANGSNNADSFFVVGNSSTTVEPGAKNLTVIGTRFEARGSNNRLMHHYWGGASTGARVEFIGTMDKHGSATQEMVRVEAYPTSGTASFGTIAFRNCELRGYHYVARDTAQNRGKLTYDVCTLLDHIDKAPVGATSFLRYVGPTIPAHRFSDCYRSSDANVGGGF